MDSKSVELLWQWSSGVQAVSALMIAGFFVMLSRTFLHESGCGGGYAGDELLVAAANIEQRLVEERLEVLRQRLLEPSAEGPAVRFSVGITDIRPGEKGEEALRLPMPLCMNGSSGGSGSGSPRNHGPHVSRSVVEIVEHGVDLGSAQRDSPGDRA